MARIDHRDIKRKEGSNRANAIHDTVPATYRSFMIGCEKYFQIDTYGKPKREVPGQPSQKIQFNKETAKKIIEILNREFDFNETGDQK